MNKIAVVFPGQGSQYIGMGKKLYELHDCIKKTFEEANAVLGFNLTDIVFSGEESYLKKSYYTQPAILTLSVALFRLYQQEIGIKPSISAGHSLGEISALCCAGAINFSDALNLVYWRGKLMQDVSDTIDGGMIAVTGINYDEVVQACEPFKNIFIANYNSNEEIILAGEKSNFSDITEILTKKCAEIIPLEVSGPFHTPLMHNAALKFQDELRKYNYDDPKWLVISNINSRPYLNKNDIVYNLTQQISSPVFWRQIMEIIIGQRVDTIIELGPKTVLKKLFKRHNKKVNVYSFDDDKDFHEIKQIYLSNETSYIVKLVDLCIVTAVSTLNRNLSDDQYLNNFSENFNKLLKLKESSKKNMESVNQGTITDAFQYLKSILGIKKVPDTIRSDIIKQILDETGLQNKILVKSIL
jgi:[acyl-carrier-protein] S-malonyltransferase